MRILYSLLFIGFSLGTQAQEGYQVTIDLTSSKDDQLSVQIQLPTITEDSAEFHMPKIVPGTYSISDFGRFIRAFDAFDKYWNLLEVTKKSVNQWLIHGAPDKISYWIDDTFDENDNYNENFIFEPAGTSFEASRNVFILNTFGVIGYIDGYKNFPFEVRVKHPENTFGATALNKEIESSTSDLYKAINYNFLADGPIMYNEPDTLTRKIAGADILISVFSPNKKITANDILKNIEDLLIAQSDYLGGQLPVDRYAFLIYLMDFSSLSQAMGALEHSYSSFYTLPEAVNDMLPQFVRDVSAHEFLHIVTPLNIHSEQIADFDYINPKMSRHLWLYEGVTEYSALHVQIKEGLFDTETFLEKVQSKIVAAQAYPLVSFTEMSQKIVEPEFKDMYRNVYEKGALIGLALDLHLIKYSNGSNNLQKLMGQLFKLYGPEKAFIDADFIDELTALTYPEIGVFFEKYVVGKQELPIYEFISWAGIEQEEGEEIQVARLGNIKLSLNDNDQFLITSTENLDDFGKEIGYNENDILKKINGQVINLEQWR